MLWKLATSPVTATRAKQPCTEARHRTIVLKPSGIAVRPTRQAGFGARRDSRVQEQRQRRPRSPTSTARIPSHEGRSRAGASALPPRRAVSCSMAKKNQIANGSALRTRPPAPRGQPAGLRPRLWGSMSRAHARDRNAESRSIQKTRRGPRAPGAVISTVNRKVVLDPCDVEPDEHRVRGQPPQRFRARRASRRSRRDSLRFRRRSRLASGRTPCSPQGPVIYAPQGPIADRANEYAPPVCGSAAAISAMLKHRPAYIAVMIRVAIKQPAEAPGRRDRSSNRKNRRKSLRQRRGPRATTPLHIGGARVAAKYSSATAYVLDALTLSSAWRGV